MAMEITSKYSVPEVTVYNETSFAQHGTDQSKSCLCTESSLDVEEIKKTSFAQHEKDQSKSCLCPESSLDVDEIKKKLMDYNIDLQTHMMPYYDTFISREHMIKITKELEELIPCLLTPKILPNLQSFFKSNEHLYIQIIFHHVLAKLNHPAKENFIHFDHVDDRFYRYISIYFDVYCDNTKPEVFINSIHEVWKYHPYIEFKLRLLCCKRLLRKKHYDILNRLLQNNEEYFLFEHKNFLPDQRFVEINLWREYAEYLTVLLILLCNNVTSMQTEKINKTVLLIVSQLSSYSSTYVSEGSEYFMLFTLSLKQTRLIPSLIKVLLNRPELHYLSSRIVSLCNDRLLEADCHNTYNKQMDCIKANSHFILNLPFLLEQRECHVRQTHCKLLLTLLHANVMCEDLTNMDHVLNRLLEFRQSLLQSENIACACFLGKQSCNHRDTNSTSSFVKCRSKKKKKKKKKIRFKCSLLALTIKDIRNKVIKEKLGPVWYLKPMIDGVEKYLESGEDLREEFIIFIEQISLHNETGLYDVVKTLCDLEMKPEIQDIFIQGLTDYIHVKCNKPNSIYSRLLLDINMTCYKGEFLQKLTINMGQLLLLDEDIGNDVEKIIYRCFCILRKQNKEIDISKYQVHFTFISTMDAEEKILKMSNFRSFLLMLILLMISSGSQHKSAKLKKYLSLKYAYEDAILYLLWCSGDVEINPGPTLKKVRPQADSVKKRNWIHEMCTTALKLLKNKAVDSKTDGLWKEKPDNWLELHGVEPFYDPRNKPKGKKYSIKNDEELLNCLLICCDRMSIKLPCNLQSEISSWKSEKRDIALLLELYVSRQEIVAMKMAKDLLIKYADTPEFKKYMKECYVNLSFNPNSTQKDSPKGYSDVVRDLAMTFCRVSKGLPIFEKSDGMWKTPPQDWNPNNLYYSPCNTEKRHEKHQDQQLIDDLLSYCEKKSKSIPSELQLVVNAWKLKNECKLEKSREICKHYTIWSSMAIIQHSLKYLEIEGLLEKPYVHQSLKQIGVSLHCEKGPKHFNSDSTDNESEVSGLPYNSISDDQRDIHSSSSSSASDSDIVCSQHPYEAKASTNSHSTKSVIKCSKPDFQNNPSTSCCTIYSTLLPCPDSRDDLQYTNEILDIPNSYKSVSEISCQEPDFQPSTSSCTFDSKRAPCQENSVDLQTRDDRDFSGSHKSLPEISHEEPDLQPSSFDCSTFTNRAEYLNVRENVPSTERIQKRRRASSKDRSDKRPRLHSGNESQASTPTPSTTRCTDDTTPSSHCDLENADQNVHSSKEDKDQGLSSNRIPVPENIQDTDSSKDQLYGSEDKIPINLHPYINDYLSCDTSNLEDNLIEDIDIEWWKCSDNYYL